jgi:hypothetical protein
MAKKKIDYFVFEPGISKDTNLFPSAVALLAANKTFLQEQVVRFINYNIANSIAPYVGYTYAPSKCTRDVGYFIDSILHDLQYGGNVKTRLTSDYFWIDGEPMIRGDVSPEITGQAYLRDTISNYIFRNITVPTTYGAPTVGQALQTKITGSPAESGADTRNVELWNIFRDVISYGTPSIPAKENGVSSIRLMGRYTHSEILLITDTESGNIIYNFSDPSTSMEIVYKNGKSSGDGQPLNDLDFPAWWQTGDCITTLYFSYDTSAFTGNDVQIFVENDSQTIRPWDFGTDAIERMRVAAPQAMLDADFEYGLQPTKWQAIGMMRNYPSLYELSGTDLTVSDVTTDASANTGNFGASLITVTTNGSHGFSTGTPITVKGLNPAVSGFSRAEGSFLVNSIISSVTFTYYSSAKVGTTTGQSLYTSYAQIRQAGFYTGAAIGSATYSLFSNGSTQTIITKFDTLPGSFEIAFNGVSPTPGSPISGSPYIPSGTSVSGVIGASTVNTRIKTTTQTTDTVIYITDATGVQAGMAIDDGSNNAIFINSIAAGGQLNLSSAYSQVKQGANRTTSSVAGTNFPANGVGATFTVARSGGAYTSVTDSGDSSGNGQGYAVGDIVKILGSDLGGVDVTNDLFLTVSTVDSAGAILTFTYSGTAASGGATYTAVNLSSTDSVSGRGAQITVVRQGGTGSYGITLVSGGTGFAQGDTLTWDGTSFGGTSPANDIVITVNGVLFGTGAIVDYTVSLTAIGVDGNQTYTSMVGISVANTGSGAVFDVVAAEGTYSATPTVGITSIGYRVGNRIVIPGNLLGGVSPLNDCTLSVNTVISGNITVVTASGTPFAGAPIVIYPAVTISEAITGEITEGATLNVGAIATIQVDFTSAHGLLPGSSILSSITSQPAPGFASTTRSLTNSQSWVSTAFYGGTFLAISSDSNRVNKSTDGQSWTNPGTLPAASSWTSIAAGPISGTTYWVAIQQTGTLAAYSTDGGANWTATGALPSSGTWTSVTYFNNVFVAVRSGSTAAAYSINGTSWVAATLPSTSNWSDVVGGIIGTSNYLVAVATGGTAAAYSVDNGANWASMTLPTSSNWSSVAFGNGRFVAVATGGTAAAVSTNGTTWTATLLPSSANWNSITFGDEVFVVVADGGTTAATSFNGTTGSWTAQVLAASGTWEEIAYGNYSGLGIFAVVGTGSNGLSISLTSANHNLAAGPFVITQVPTSTSLRFPARTTGTINASSAISGVMYARPDSFFVHRPFDGGVMLGTGGPQHGAQAIRQSKKYIRYQSGKGIMYTTGALFAPNYNLASATAAGYATGSYITMSTDDTDHGLQPGGVIEVTGFNSFEYNGTYTVESIISSRAFRVRALVPLSTLVADIGPRCLLSVKSWHGSTVRVGAFDDQNGIFYQYDGQELSFVRRSSTFQLAGQCAINTESNLVQGTGTRFTSQLKVHDKVVIRGMTHTVTSITNDTTLTVAPDWRGVNNVVGVKMCLVKELVIPQSEWNMDKGDGTGPSGYNIIPQRMQMIGIQYSWYAAGFIEFMIRGADGKFVFLHRIRNSNINYEAYMRTANLPVRYEVENRSALDKLSADISSNATSLYLTDASRFPSSGTIYVDNELIFYSGKSGNRLTGLSRAANLSNFAAGQNRTYTAGSATTHATGAGVALVSCTITPTINHWGSAILTDGMFDEDRGYIFNYAATGLSASIDKQTAFMIRLAPSVSNALVGDLGERDLLNRAQLLLNEISVTADSGTGAIIVEGILNPRNYPSDPTKITWSGLSSAGAGGQPSFAQVALGGAINWGGVPLTTSTATIQGALTASLVARAFSNVTNTITALNFSPSGPTTGNTTYLSALSTGRTDFLITNAAYDTLTSTTPLRVGDTLAVATYLTSGQQITNITRSYLGTAYTQIVMNVPANLSSPTTTGQNIAITVTSSISTQYASAISTARTDFLVLDTDYTASGILAGDTVQVASFLTTNQTVSGITPSYARVASVNYTRIVLSSAANGTSLTGSGNPVTTTVTASGTAANYAATNYLFFTNASWNASGASTGTRVATSFTQFPAGTSVAGITSRTLGGVTVRRVSFTQTSGATLAAAATVTFQFGDVQYALPGEQVFSFISNPGSTTSINLSQLKELTTTAIGGRGAFPNGPDVLAINIYKVAGTAVASGIILRWGEAQA